MREIFQYAITVFDSAGVSTYGATFKGRLNMKQNVP